MVRRFAHRSASLLRRLPAPAERAGGGRSHSGRRSRCRQSRDYPGCSTARQSCRGGRGGVRGRDRRFWPRSSRSTASARAAASMGAARRSPARLRRRASTLVGGERARRLERREEEDAELVRLDVQLRVALLENAPRRLREVGRREQRKRERSAVVAVAAVRLDVWHRRRRAPPSGPPSQWHRSSRGWSRPTSRGSPRGDSRR